MSMSVYYRGALTVLQMYLTRTDQRRRIASLDLLVALCLMKPRRLLAFHTAQAHCWVMGTLVSTRTLRAFFATLFPSWLSPAYTGAWDYFSTGAGLGISLC